MTWGALLIAVAIVVALLAALLEFGSGSPNEATQAAGMTGYWQATGQVLSAHDSAIQTPGESIGRRWRIDGDCKHGCHLELTREIGGATVQEVGGVMTAPLTWDAGHWRAAFSEANVYCLGADGTTTVPATEDSTWTITLVASGRITAVEHTTTAGFNCITGTTELRWTARKATIQQAQVYS